MPVNGLVLAIGGFNPVASACAVAKAHVQMHTDLAVKALDVHVSGKPAQFFVKLAIQLYILSDLGGLLQRPFFSALRMRAHSHEQLVEARQFVTIDGTIVHRYRLNLEHFASINCRQGGPLGGLADITHAARFDNDYPLHLKTLYGIPDRHRTHAEVRRELLDIQRVTVLYASANQPLYEVLIDLIAQGSPVGLRETNLRCVR